MPSICLNNVLELQKEYIRASVTMMGFGVAFIPKSVGSFYINGKRRSWCANLRVQTPKNLELSLYQDKQDYTYLSLGLMIGFKAFDVDQPYFNELYRQAMLNSSKNVLAHDLKELPQPTPQRHEQQSLDVPQVSLENTAVKLSGPAPQLSHLSVNMSAASLKLPLSHAKLNSTHSLHHSYVHLRANESS